MIFETKKPWLNLRTFLAIQAIVMVAQELATVANNHLAIYSYMYRYLTLMCVIEVRIIYSLCGGGGLIIIIDKHHHFNAAPKIFYEMHN